MVLSGSPYLSLPVSLCFSLFIFHTSLHVAVSQLSNDDRGKGRRTRDDEELGNGAEGGGGGGGERGGGLMGEGGGGAGNDGRPVEYNIREELPIGSFIANVKQDSNITTRFSPEDTQRLKFEFRRALLSSVSVTSSAASTTTREGYRYFSIDGRRGVVSTAQVLDRELICPPSRGCVTSCDISFDVTIKLATQFVQLYKTVVHVVDINDHAPTFPHDYVTINMAETTQPGALFPVSSAEDADCGSLGVQEYQLLSDHDQFQLQVTDHVDGSKEIWLRLAGRLDREAEDAYVVTVLAVDGGRPQRTGTVIINIIVADTNDNSPQFDSSSYETTIHENLPAGTSVLSVYATDPDQGLGGVVVYSFADFTEHEYGTVFRIDSRTGEIYLVRDDGVDFETTTSFQLTVVAMDMGTGSLPVFAKVTINVLDVNDNAPVITVTVLTDTDTAQVRENSPAGTFVAHLAVTDADTGANGQTECSIDGRGRFKLESLYESEYKLVTSLKLDREEADEYSVTMTCRDKAVDSLSTSTRIDVTVTDENDHAPQLPSDVYVAEIDENNDVGAVVTRVNGTDDDVGKNGALIYRIQPLTSSLPTSTRGASDGTSGAGGGLGGSRTGGDIGDVVSIDPLTGIVTARVSFDYEKRREYRFLVTAADRGEPPRTATATLLLYVTDLNDERPRFERPTYAFTTPENSPLGTSVGRVNTTDEDRTADFRRTAYFLRQVVVPGGEGEGGRGTGRFIPSFEIDASSGVISNARRLDREEQIVHDLVVVAIDEGSLAETSINVTVYVDDVNDNNPIFQLPARGDFDASITISAPGAGSTAGDSDSSEGLTISAGTFVMRVMATDADTGNNAEIRYSIASGNVGNIFIIDSVTGAITVARALSMKAELTDADNSEKLYKLVIVAKDNGHPPLMSVADLRVILSASGATGTERGKPGWTSGEPSPPLKTSNVLEANSNVVMIAVGTACGFLLIFLVVIIIVVCCFRRQGRLTTKKYVTQMVAAAASAAASAATAAAASAAAAGGGSSCSHRRCRQSLDCNYGRMSGCRVDGGGSITTMETGSVLSGCENIVGEHQVRHYHHHQRGGHSWMECRQTEHGEKDEEGYTAEDEELNPWRQLKDLKTSIDDRIPQDTIMPTRIDAMRIVYNDSVLSTTSQQSAAAVAAVDDDLNPRQSSSLTPHACRGGATRYRDRTGSPANGPNPSNGDEGASCGSCSCHLAERRLFHQMHRQYSSSQHHSRNQSPEMVSILYRHDHGSGGSGSGVEGVRDSGGGVIHDSESLCSWPDSGRGPSEEDDPFKHQLDPLLKHCHNGSVSPCCRHHCNSRLHNDVLDAV